MRKCIITKLSMLTLITVFAFTFFGIVPGNISYAANVGDTFTSNITVGSDNAVPCTFVITGTNTAQIGQGITAIPASTSGALVIPDTVTYEGKSYTVTALYDYCFDSCDNLTSTGLANNNTVTSLGDNCFGWCPKLTSTGLGANSSVKTIGWFCFAGCTSLTDTGFGTNHTIDTISEGCFESCPMLADTGLETNNAVKYVKNAAFCMCASLTSTGLKTNNTVVLLDGSCFESCPKLADTGLENNSSVKSIVAVGFGNDPSIVHAAVGSGVTSIGIRSLGWNSALTDVCFYGDAISSIPNYWTDSAIKVYYLSENSGWSDVTVPNASSVTSLSRVKVVGGSTDSKPTNYWSLSTGNGADSATEGRFAEGDKVALSLKANNNPKFLKWTSDDPTGTFDNDALPTAIYTVGKSAGKETSTITALYSDCTVAFDSNGGSKVASQSVDYNSKADKPSDPVKESCKFDGWYTDNNCKKAYDFNNPVTSDITLYAKWTANKYTVKFNSDGGSAVASQTVNYKSKATKPADPIYKGYNFIGWYADSDCTKAYDFNTSITSDRTLYGKWEKVTTTSNTQHTNTGDTSMLPLYVILGGASIALLIVIAILRYKKTK